ncbi:hypothetical protein SAMN05444280_101186 [Tangfeifania diversioriginum]|uniref:Uncharacterized protein n=1 Tax=Tangfeifania diversioriginum TaxID=1168035 RepID=A0A1M6AFI2_9BACT|nr:hypothetical protein SAMN05444280_101186 [Tangfeifania diversioriginum]
MKICNLVIVLLVVSMNALGQPYIILLPTFS